VIIFSILDNLDGYLARSKNQITEFGKIVDPLVDKLFIITIALNLYLLKLLPLWFMLVVVLRDILIMLGGLILMKKVDQVPQSDFIGKLTVGAIGIVFLLSILDYQKLKDVFNLSLILCTLLIFISLINYGNKQFIRKK
ncbi:MAG: CDP-alcohol phosphatidyltransferase family protein, partial [bacterium]|nr:CDP-alcohol phosphatidyltransferase family protein [bacterium]